VRFRAGRARKPQPVPIEWIGGSTTLQPGRIELEADPAAIQTIRVAYDFEVKGLPPPQRFEGLGAPCLMIEDNPSAANNPESMRAARKAFAATLVVRFPEDSSILDRPATPGTYDVLDPTTTVAVRIGPTDIPLEIDFTTPIIYSITQRKEKNPGLKALFRTDEWAGRGGLFPVQPIRKDRIPVILIHGLASDPFTWIPLYNDLMADEAIRTRFQFLVWFYPTGQPVILAAAQLREKLTALHAELQRGDPSPALDSMVLCGHSLGGVLTHYLVIDSGSLLEKAVMRVPIDETALRESDKEYCRDILEYEALPFVSRAIFYATPHRGAPNARKGLFQWLAGFIRLPASVTGQYGRIRPYLNSFARKGRVTSLESLHPDSPLVAAMNSAPIAGHIRYHSIIADEREAGRTGGTDGFVPYASSHIDGATSEVVLHSGHSVQQTPLGAQETRRILLEHLAAFDAARSTASK
jgi:pimeloyl-ACP methyl ester carboxylesterase